MCETRDRAEDYENADIYISTDDDDGWLPGDNSYNEAEILAEQHAGQEHGMTQ